MSDKNIKVERSNPGWLKRLVSQYSKFNTEIAVGYPADSEAATVSYQDGTRVIDVAAYNEFGTDGGIPARPFLGNATDEINETSKKILSATVVRVNKGDLKIDQSLEKLGNLAAGIVKKSITELREPPNAESTIKAKGSSNPLIDTGLLRQTATYSIRDK